MPVARNLAAMFAKLKGLKSGKASKLLNRASALRQKMGQKLNKSIGKTMPLRPGMKMKGKTMPFNPAKPPRIQNMAGMVRRAGEAVKRTATSNAAKNTAAIAGVGGLIAAPQVAAFGIGRHQGKKPGSSSSGATAAGLFGGPGGYLGYRSGMKSKMKNLRVRRAAKKKA